MSVYEGFGLPALEAMQCGTPTISSNNSSIPEVVGNAGVLISPYDEDALAQSMLTIYNNEGLQSKYSELGIKRATEFSWEKTVNQYETIFNKILN